MKRLTVLPCALMLALGLSATGCFEVTVTSAPEPTTEMRVHLDFPEGWSELGQQEWREMDLGPNRTLVTIMDAERAASFSVIPVPLDGASRIMSEALADAPDAHNLLNTFLIDAAGPDSYQNYQLIRMGKTQFAGRSSGEIVFQGQKPGKNLRWHRLLISASPGRADELLFLFHSTPIERDQEFAADFRSIEQSWQWQDQPSQ